MLSPPINPLKCTWRVPEGLAERLSVLAASPGLTVEERGPVGKPFNCDEIWIVSTVSLSPEQTEKSECALLGNRRPDGYWTLNLFATDYPLAVKIITLLYAQGATFESWDSKGRYQAFTGDEEACANWPHFLWSNQATVSIIPALSCYSNSSLVLPGGGIHTMVGPIYVCVGEHLLAEGNTTHRLLMVVMPTASANFVGRPAFRKLCDQLRAAGLHRVFLSSEEEP